MGRIEEGPEKIITFSDPIHIGQLCQYAYLFCRDKIGKMVIVGASEPTREVEQYLATLRKNHSLLVYYINV